MIGLDLVDAWLLGVRVRVRDRVRVRMRNRMRVRGLALRLQLQLQLRFLLRLQLPVGRPNVEPILPRIRVTAAQRFLVI